MKKNHINQLSILFLFGLVAISNFLSAQNQEGNIVQYFGKEKVEDVNEGEVLHLFKEGLILEQKRSRFSAKSVDSDPVWARISSEGQSGIEEGKLEGDEFSWTDSRLDGAKNVPKIKKTFWEYETPPIPIGGILTLTFGELL